MYRRLTLRFYKTILIAAGATLCLAACSKNEDTSAATLADAKSPAKAKAAMQAEQAAAAPRGDKAVPLDRYQELKSGRQLMYAFLATSLLPIDFEKTAADVSPDYDRERDEFKKRDLLAALRPAIQAEVDKAKSQRYYFMDIGRGAVLDKYDFTQQAFPIPELKDRDGYRYFGDLNRYALGFSNASAYGTLKVADENTARAIEGLRTQYDKLHLRVYFFVNDTELGTTRLKGEIMRVQLRDRNGAVLAEQ